MVYEDIPEISRRLRRFPIEVPFHNGSTECLDALAPEILLPHREPFLLLDSLTAYDLKSRRISARRFISSDDPVMRGHFPGAPAYPGVLQMEMIGQAALCLIALLDNDRSGRKAATAISSSLRGVRIFDGIFQSMVIPDATVDIKAEILEYDAPSWVFGGQLAYGNQILCSSVMEVYLPEC